MPPSQIPAGGIPAPGSSVQLALAYAAGTARRSGNSANQKLTSLWQGPGLIARIDPLGQGELGRYLRSLLGNRHDAEDVLQRASMTMWRRFETFEPGTDFMAWASTVAFYEAKNFQRVTARSRLRFDDELLNTLATERLDDLRHLDERFDALEHCVGKLDAANRKLVEAVYGEDADIVALAAQIGRAPQTLYNRLNVIRRALADCVERRLAEGRA